MSKSSKSGRLLLGGSSVPLPTDDEEGGAGAGVEVGAGGGSCMYTEEKVGEGSALTLLVLLEELE